MRLLKYVILLKSGYLILDWRPDAVVDADTIFDVFADADADAAWENQISFLQYVSTFYSKQ